MGILETTIDRVGTLEHRMNEHDAGHLRIERRLDQLTSDLAQVKARVEVIPELQAGQIELREMVAKLLAWSETSSAGS